MSRYFLGSKERCVSYLSIDDLEKKGISFLYSDPVFRYRAARRIKADEFSGFYVFYIQPPSLPVHLYGQYWWEASPKVKVKVYKEYGSGEGSLRLAWLKTKPEDRVFWGMVHPYTIYAAFKPTPNGPAPRSAEEAKRVGDEIFWYDRVVNLKDIEENFEFRIDGNCRKWHDFTKWYKIEQKYLIPEAYRPFIAEKKFKESVAFGDPVKTRLCEKRARLIREFVVSSRGRRCCPGLYRKYIARKQLLPEERKSRRHLKRCLRLSPGNNDCIMGLKLLGVRRMEWWYPELWGREGRSRYEAVLSYIQEEKEWVSRDRRLREALRREGGDAPLPEKLRGWWKEMWGEDQKGSK